MNDKPETDRPKPKIWNPNAAANWSLLFSPAFGAILQAMNWKELGQPDRAKTNKTWACVTIIFLLLFALIPVNVGGIGGLIGLILLLSWYFSQGRAQAKYVKETYGKEYEKKGWAKPLLIGIGCFIGYVIFAIIVGVIYGILFEIPPEQI